jgi:periplasmic divalent cation tolerance protein
MRIFYITLNTADEARQISRALLEQQLAVCTNWFPITCAYRWEGKIVEEPETVLLVKTQAGYRIAVEQVIHQHINYTNLIAEIAPESVKRKLPQVVEYRGIGQLTTKRYPRLTQETVRFNGC